MNAVSKQQWPKVQYSLTQLGGGVTPAGQSYPGGLDLTTPSLRLQAGTLRDSINFECAQSGGYARIEGYERLDGHAAPSSATWTLVQVASFVNVPVPGLTVTQVSTGARGTIVAFVTGGATPYIALTAVAGGFDHSGALNMTTGGGPILLGFATAPTVIPDTKTRAIYTAAAADYYRTLINAVPGSGPLLGVVGMVFNGVDNVYAFRANGPGTAVNLFKATPGGWSFLPLYNLVSFTAGTGTIPLDGGTLTQGGVTATIKRVMWQSGAWAGSAVGQFVVTNPTGGDFAAGAATTTGGGSLTLAGAQAAITMAPGGRFEFEKCNFSGQLITRRIYGCDGVNPCFEFDGETLAPIKTGLAPDAPSHIRFHKNFLFVAQASSLSYCGAGTPFKWSAVDGGGEIATGDTVNGMITLPGSQTTATMAVFLRGNTAFLYGTDPTTFNFVTFNTNIGALPYSTQNLFDTFFLDALGVVTLKTTLNWGNFLPTTLTKSILPFIVQERTKLTASSINRAKSQYRLFFNDGYALYCTTINQQYMGATPQLFPNPVYCVDETSLADGTEATYFGSADGLGYVYQLDKGTSFDGAAINAYITTAWDPVKSPRILKRFRASSIEVQGGGYAEIQYGYLLGYGNTQIGQPVPVTAPLNLGNQSRWDALTWDEFIWDGVGLQPTDVDVTGTAENIQVTIASGTNYIPAYTANSVIHHYSVRRGMRV
jgi:hypothetical protein